MKAGKGEWFWGPGASGALQGSPRSSLSLFRDSERPGWGVGVVGAKNENALLAEHNYMTMEEERCLASDRQGPAV